MLWVPYQKNKVAELCNNFFHIALQNIYFHEFCFALILTSRQVPTQPLAKFPLHSRWWRELKGAKQENVHRDTNKWGRVKILLMQPLPSSMRWLMLSWSVSRKTVIAPVLFHPSPYWFWLWYNPPSAEAGSITVPSILPIACLLGEDRGRVQNTGSLITEQQCPEAKKMCYSYSTTQNPG